MTVHPPLPVAMVCAGLLTFVPTAAAAMEPNDPRASTEGLDSDAARARIGFDTSLGTVFDPRSTGIGFALRLRTGVQLGRLVAISIQSTTFVLTNAQSLFPEGLGALLEHGAMLHLTPVDALDLGIGAALDFGQTRSRTADGKDAPAVDRLMFALTARIALHVGRTNPATGRRVAFTFGACPHLVFAPTGAVLVVTLGPGAEWY